MGECTLRKQDILPGKTLISRAQKHGFDPSSVNAVWLVKVRRRQIMSRCKAMQQKLAEIHGHSAAGGAHDVLHGNGFGMAAAAAFASHNVPTTTAAPLATSQSQPIGTFERLKGLNTNVSSPRSARSNAETISARSTARSVDAKSERMTLALERGLDAKLASSMSTSTKEKRGSKEQSRLNRDFALSQEKTRSPAATAGAQRGGLRAPTSGRGAADKVPKKKKNSKGQNSKSGGARKSAANSKEFSSKVPKGVPPPSAYISPIKVNNGVLGVPTKFTLDKLPKGPPPSL